jgi:hypothetical protein
MSIRGLKLIIVPGTLNKKQYGLVLEYSSLNLLDRILRFSFFFIPGGHGAKFEFCAFQFKLHSTEQRIRINKIVMRLTFFCKW